MCLVYFLLALVLVIVGYFIYMQYTKYTDDTIEGFYPRRWWSSGYNRRWAWNRPWYHSWGNWRPYGYYPAYSGYWKQCPQGTWCPSYINCNSPQCM